MKFEIKGLWQLGPGRVLPCTLSIREYLWWRFMPGVTVNVRWPAGWVELDQVLGGGGVGRESADPNEHYRPFLEKYVGRQGWDWNWGLADRDATDNRLTIKIRRKHEKYATIIAMRWT